MNRHLYTDQEGIMEGGKGYFRVFLFVLLVFLGLFSVRTIHNPDLFWHLKVGEDIIKTAAVPVFDSYSYHEGLRFFAHEWLFDIILSSIYAAFGMYGILAFMQIIGMATAYAIYKNTRLGMNSYSFALFMCFFIAGLYVSSFLVPRPQMISCLLAVIVFYLLSKWFGETAAVMIDTAVWVKRYIVFALISVLWINIHGGSYPLLIILMSGFGLEILIAYMKDRNEETLNRLIRLISFGVCALLAFCINPYGVRMLAFPFLLTGDTTTYFIQEWKSPDFHGAIGIYRYIIMSLPVIAMISSKKYINIRTKWYVFLFSFMALSSGRHFSLLVLFNYISTAPYFYSMVVDSWGKIIIIVTKLFRKYLMVLLAFSATVIAFNVYVWATVEPIELTEYPVEALAYIDEQGLPVQNDILFNYYGWGGYMIFTDYTVFIDGRADVYQEKINTQSQVMNDYLDTIQLVKVEENLEKYDCHFVLQPSDGVLAQYLRMHPDWTVLFESEEENSILLVRNQLSM